MSDLRHKGVDKQGMASRMNNGEAMNQADLDILISDLVARRQKELNSQKNVRDRFSPEESEQFQNIIHDIETGFNVLGINNMDGNHKYCLILGKDGVNWTHEYKFKLPIPVEGMPPILHQPGADNSKASNFILKAIKDFAQQKQENGDLENDRDDVIVITQIKQDLQTGYSIVSINVPHGALFVTVLQKGDSKKPFVHDQEIELSDLTNLSE